PGSLSPLRLLEDDPLGTAPAEEEAGGGSPTERRPRPAAHPRAGPLGRQRRPVRRRGVERRHRRPARWWRFPAALRLLHARLGQVVAELPRQEGGNDRE